MRHQVHLERIGNPLEKWGQDGESLEKTRWGRGKFAVVLWYNCVTIQPGCKDGDAMDLRDSLIDWDEPDDEGSNTAHIAVHGLTPDEVESAFFDANTTFDLSDSSGRPIAFGTTDTGRF